MGLERTEVPEANAGDIIAITGIEARISPILLRSGQCRSHAGTQRGRANRDHVVRVNNSPFAGQDGKYVTSRQIASALIANSSLMLRCAWKTPAARTNPRLRPRELHLGILIRKHAARGLRAGSVAPAGYYQGN